MKKLLLTMLLLKALYTPVAGSDPEYAQGAIERNELAHREIARFVWIIEVPEPGDRDEWQRRLNAAVEASHGAFEVVAASEEERRRVECGEITLQR
jgi:hypothetical protein